ATDFTAEAPGKLVKIPEGNHAFVPNPLPPNLHLDWQLANQLSEANLALGELSGAGRILPNPHMLIGPFLRREAILSSKIEGTIASSEELLLFEVDPAPKPDNVNALEVANYVAAMEQGLRRLKDLP